jgi:MtN3 and saliva related transmembrane protein
MQSTLLEVLGFAAGACTTLAFLPQITKVWRTKQVNDISLGMYSIFVLGVALWLSYGLLRGALPIVVANAVTLALSGSVLVMKLRYDHRAAREERSHPMRPH